MRWMTGLGLSALLASAAWSSGPEREGPVLARRGGADHAEIVLVARDADGETWRARTVVTAGGARTTIDEQVVLAPDGWLRHGFVRIAPSAGAMVRRWYEPAIATVIVEEDGVAVRYPTPDDAPWVHEPVTVAGVPIVTRLSAWSTYRAATGAPLVRVVGAAASQRIPSDQLLVATELGPRVVAGEAAVALDPRFGLLSGRVSVTPTLGR